MRVTPQQERLLPHLEAAGAVMAADRTESEMIINAPSSSSATERDLRLDFFRGLALFCIFIDHIPNNILAGVYDAIVDVRRRLRSVYFHLWLYRRHGLRSRHGAPGLPANCAARVSSSVATLCRPRLSIYDVHGDGRLIRWVLSTARSMPRSSAPPISSTSRGWRWSRRSCCSSSRPSWTYCRFTSFCSRFSLSSDRVSVVAAEW